VRPVGANKETAVDLRVVAATARDLEKLAQSGKFREDLYYRLNVFTLRVPSLRERPGDLPLLARYFAHKIAERHGLPGSVIDAETMKLIKAYDWPGNVRELENAMERAVVLAGGETILPDHLPERVRQTATGRMPYESGDLSVKTNLHELERDLIIQAMRRSGGNKSRAAKMLDLSLRALLYKLRDYGLEPNRPEAEDEP
jgi:two-component system response regulator AtoC